MFRLDVKYCQLALFSRGPFDVIKRQLDVKGLEYTLFSSEPYKGYFSY